LQGYNGTVFAYGQTGAGKTHTMEGSPDGANEAGILPQSFQHIFGHVAANSSSQQFLVIPSLAAPARTCSTSGEALLPGSSSP
jgi:kinesin family protein 3/17